jgi:hypothetical protein
MSLAAAYMDGEVEIAAAESGGPRSPLLNSDSTEIPLIPNSLLWLILKLDLLLMYCNVLCYKYLVERRKAPWGMLLK